MSHVSNKTKLARLEGERGNPVIEGKPQPQQKVGVVWSQSRLMTAVSDCALDDFWDRWGGTAANKLWILFHTTVYCNGVGRPLQF